VRVAIAAATDKVRKFLRRQVWFCSKNNVSEMQRLLAAGFTWSAARTHVWEVAKVTIYPALAAFLCVNIVAWPTLTQRMECSAD